MEVVFKTWQLAGDPYRLSADGRLQHEESYISVAAPTSAIAGAIAWILTLRIFLNPR